jgi:hypothetical protein
MTEGSGSVPLTNGSLSGRPIKHMDPDLQRWFLRLVFNVVIYQNQVFREILPEFYRNFAKY